MKERRVSRHRQQQHTRLLVTSLPVRHPYAAALDLFPELQASELKGRRYSVRVSFLEVCEMPKLQMIFLFSASFSYWLEDSVSAHIRTLSLL